MSLREIKINKIIETGNRYDIDCICNEGYFTAEFDDITSEVWDKFNRTLLHKFTYSRDSVPEDTTVLTNNAIDIMCEEYGYNKGDFINEM